MKTFEGGDPYDQWISGEGRSRDRGKPGQGRAIALALAEAGADVAVNYDSHEHEALDVSKTIEGFGRRSVVVQADVSQAVEVMRSVKTIEHELGEIDILVNNAGIARASTIDTITERDGEELLITNLTASRSCEAIYQDQTH
jgi:3-oxoacyl-[acyl-carrier protein] reductase